MMPSVKHVARAAAGVGAVAVALALWTSDHPASKRPGPNAAPASAVFDRSDERVLNAYGSLPVAFVENRGRQ